MTNFDDDKIQKLKTANARLMIENEENNRDLIFIYCPPKVGSTSLVSSIRLFANEKYNVIHLHSEIILKLLYNIDVSINEIIQYNSYLGKKIFVFDIYRMPIEHKISIFFEKLEKFHFNSQIEIIEKFDISTIIDRFNNLFPYLGGNDYYRNEYGINFPGTFDFDKRFSLVEDKNIKYIKLRLFDSIQYWPDILREILEIEVKIVRDYETIDKPIKDVYRKFMELYRIPLNLFETIKNDESLFYYTSKDERHSYFSKWESRTTESKDFYSLEEYKFYLKLSTENQHMSELQGDHYIDSGCTCISCSEKRNKSREDFKLRNIQPVRIKHELQQYSKIPNSKKFRKNGPFRNVNFNMMKGT